MTCHFIAARQFSTYSEKNDNNFNKFNLLNFLNAFRSPLEKFPFYMLIETSGSNHGHDEEKLNNFLQKAMETNLVVDGVSTNEPGKMKNIWAMRERIADSLINIDGYCFKYDISLPLTHFYEIVPVTKERVGDLASFVCGYGHVGKERMQDSFMIVFTYFYSPKATRIFT